MEFQPKRYQNRDLDKDKIWYWYQHVINCISQEMPRSNYARKFNIPIKDLERYYWLIVHKQMSDPDEYSLYTNLHEEFLESGLTSSQFSTERNLNANKFRHFAHHKRHKDLIEQLKLEDRPPMVFTPFAETEIQNQFEPEPEKPLTFRQIANPESKEVVAPEPEPAPEPTREIAPIQHHDVIEAQNDIEIAITKGVRVLISPSLDSMKIIKIIELLKDL